MASRRFEVLGNYLTLAEVRIIILELYCKTRHQTATILGCSENTVCTHIKNVYRKYNLHCQRELFNFGHDNGFRNGGFFQGENVFEGIANVPW